MYTRQTHPKVYLCLLLMPVCVIWLWTCDVTWHNRFCTSRVGGTGGALCPTNPGVPVTRPWQIMLLLFYSLMLSSHAYYASEVNVLFSNYAEIFFSTQTKSYFLVLLVAMSFHGVCSALVVRSCSNKCLPYIIGCTKKHPALCVRMLWIEAHA